MRTSNQKDEKEENHANFLRKTFFKAFLKELPKLLQKVFWIPASAGMTKRGAGMTKGEVTITEKGATITERGAGRRLWEVGKKTKKESSSF